MNPVQKDRKDLLSVMITLVTNVNVDGTIFKWIDN